MILHKSINFHDYDEPIAPYFDDRTYIEVIPEYRKIQNMFVEKNEAEMADSLLQLWEPSEEEFIQINEGNHHMNKDEEDQ